MTHNLATLIAFPVLIIYSASAELLSLRNAGRVSVLLVGAFVVVGFAAQMPVDEILAGLACGFAVLLVTFALFCFGWISSGDAKLVAATAAWIGWDHLLDFAAVALFLGAGMSLALQLWRARPLPAVFREKNWLTRLHDQAGPIPYGVAAAIAALMLYPGAQDWVRLLSDIRSV